MGVPGACRTFAALAEDGQVIAAIYNTLKRAGSFMCATYW